MAGSTKSTPEQRAKWKSYRQKKKLLIEAAEKKKAYMRDYARKNKDKAALARRKHAQKKLAENPEHLMTRDSSFTALPENLPCPSDDPSKQLMEKELSEIPETIKRIESQNKTIIFQLNQLSTILTDLYNWFQRRSASETPATRLVNTFIETPPATDEPPDSDGL